MPRVWRAEPHEVETVASLIAAFRAHLDLAAPSDADIRSGVERLIGDPDTEFLLASAGDGEPASGVAQLRFRYGIWRAGGDCLLEDLFVLEPARGAGLGRALVQATLDRSRARNCRRVELDVNERNETALRLYGAFGFSATANAYGARDLYMRLHLD